MKQNRQPFPPFPAKEFLILGSVIGIPIAIFVLGAKGCEAYKRNSRHIDLFQPYIESYANATGRSRPDNGNAAYLQGKVFVVEEHDVSPVEYRLPDELVANNPDEVGTIVQVSYTRKEVGKWSNGTPGYQWTGHVKIIDRSSGETIVEDKSFDGDPQGTVGGGDKPESAISNYLVGLERR